MLGPLSNIQWIISISTHNQTPLSLGTPRLEAILGTVHSAYNPQTLSVGHVSIAITLPAGNSDKMKQIETHIKILNAAQPDMRHLILLAPSRPINSQ
jgi:hypothetical protein